MARSITFLLDLKVTGALQKNSLLLAWWRKPSLLFQTRHVCNPTDGWAVLAQEGLEVHGIVHVIRLFCSFVSDIVSDVERHTMFSYRGREDRKYQLREKKRRRQ